MMIIKMFGHLSLWKTMCLVDLIEISLL